MENKKGEEEKECGCTDTICIKCAIPSKPVKPSERIEELVEIYMQGPNIGPDTRVMAHISAIMDYLDEESKKL